MERLGFIHEDLDIKILILFVLRRLPWYVDMQTLAEICQLGDGGVGYFEFSDCLCDLVEVGQVEETELGYRITEKGAWSVDTVESSLPFSVRVKTKKALEPFKQMLAREAMIKTSHEMTDTGCMVSLEMGDGVGKIIGLQLVCADDAQARAIEKSFRKNAEDVYQKIIAMLIEEKKK